MYKNSPTSSVALSLRISHIELISHNAMGHSTTFHVHVCTGTIYSQQGVCDHSGCTIMCVDEPWYLSTVGSRLSEPRLSVSAHLDVGSRRHVFSPSGKNMLRSLEFCYRRNQSCCTNDFSERYNAFPIQYEASNAVVRCITAWQIKRRGK